MHLWNTGRIYFLLAAVSYSWHTHNKLSKKGKGSPYSITERRVPELILVLGSQPAGDVSHKPDGWLLLLSARLAVTPVTLKSAATNFAAWWTEAQWVWTVCLRLLPDRVVAAIWTRYIRSLEGWLSSRVVSVLDSGAEGPGFKSQPQRYLCCDK